jgi:peptidoglycan/LPS O-acetylase OafA/YrhL
MRAIAVLSVVVVHVSVFASAGTVPAARALTHLNVGVTVFFLISGFLLYRPFIAHRPSASMQSGERCAPSRPTGSR